MATSQPPEAPAPPPAPAPSGPRPARGDLTRAAALALALGLAYAAPGATLPGNDATASVYTAASLLAEGRFTLAPSRAPWLFRWEDLRPGRPALRLFDLATLVDGVPAARRYADGELRPVPPYFLARAVRDDPATGEPRYLSSFGPGAPLTALPVLAPLAAVFGDLRGRPELLWGGARAAALLLTALAGALVFLSARRWLAPWPAALLALAWGLGTPAWSLASQTLWQHPGDLFFLSLGAFFLVRRRGGAPVTPGEPAPGGDAAGGAARAPAARLAPIDAALAGLAFSLAAACRPQGALFALAAAAVLLLTDRRAAAALVAGALPAALALAAFNWWYLGSPLRFGQVEVGGAIALAKTGLADPWPFRLQESLPGLLVSPSRGLLAFSPFLVFSAAGAVLAFRRPAFHPLRPLVVAAAAALVVEAGWFDWWGGWSYGWRRLCDLGPALALLLVPLAGWLGATWPRRALLLALTGWAVLLQGAGAFAYDLTGWNARRAWRIERPGGEEVRLLDPAEATRAVAAGGRVRLVEHLDVDAPAHRHRLWSLADSQPVHTLAGFGVLRRSRRQQADAWLEHWRPPRP
ncbi:MAG: hypothetical protein IPO09_15095 [Anaeromyxobacter sp.]|nr:hypothetical protein [Anaeromyxobacter sp.]MBL0277079.1 hypothetical protein [Anaeromyxobacter sp.]